MNGITEGNRLIELTKDERAVIGYALEMLGAMLELANQPMVLAAIRDVTESAKKKMGHR